MSDKPVSPTRARNDSPPPHKSSRNGGRSQSPPRNRHARDRGDENRREDARPRDDMRDRGDRYRGGRDRDRDREDRDRYRDRDRDRDRDRGGQRPPRKNFGGFRYKDKRRDEGEEDGDRDRRGTSFRGYRNRSPSPRRRDRDRDAGAASSSSSKKPKKSKTAAGDGGDTSQPPARAPAAANPSMGGGEEMIIVHVNDRLGTKAAIPCFASDRIKEFKIMVAARIGREPHEILLKRQGQRPFKDMLTLADYEISNGVQLDLEVDTGD
ncbi:ubiquitin-like protein [Biscogniauxia sp. FL1348]|nr:ubiquitin-like protein [Biscogniauxia sp. FL1348]